MEMNDDIIFLGLVVLLIVGGFIIGFIVAFEFVDKYPFETIARKVANSYTYNDTFKCSEFTNALIKELKTHGYNAKASYGWANLTNETGYHAWTTLEIHIESITGRVISPKEFKNHYNLTQ